jgi:hypothetical protein
MFIVFQEGFKFRDGCNAQQVVRSNNYIDDPCNVDMKKPSDSVETSSSSSHQSVSPQGHQAAQSTSESSAENPSEGATTSNRKFHFLSFWIYSHSHSTLLFALE